MSVTFTFNGAPQHTETCEWCQQARQDAAKRDPYTRGAIDGSWLTEQDVAKGLTEHQLRMVRCDPWCSGEHTDIAAESQLDITNVSAALVFKMLDLRQWGEVQDGQIPLGDLPLIQRRIMRRLAGDLSPFTSEPSDEQGWVGPSMTTDPETGMPTITPGHAQGPRVIYQGTSIDRVSRYLTRLQSILTQAAEAGEAVHWS